MREGMKKYNQVKIENRHKLTKNQDLKILSISPTNFEGI